MNPPRHLRNNIINLYEDKKQCICSYRLKCSCGCEEFILSFPGEIKDIENISYPVAKLFDNKTFFIINAECKKCNKSFVVFDKDFHGWDGFICGEKSKQEIPRPSLVRWKCQSCGSLNHKVIVKLAYMSKDIFMQECEGDYNEEQWPDSFEWIWISIHCINCDLEIMDWVDYETA